MSENRKKKVSVVIPAFNSSEYIKRAIKSVIQQTYSNFEIIVVDDGSSDNTKEIVSEIDDHRLMYFFQKNNGPASARNKGIVKSTGDYIAFLDSDDFYYSKDFLAQMIQTLLFENRVWAYSFCVFWDKDNNLIRDLNMQNYKGWVYQRLIKGKWFSSSTVMVKKSVFADVGLFDEKLKINYEDVDMFMRIALKYQVSVCEEIMVVTEMNREASFRNTKNYYEKYLHKVKFVERYSQKRDRIFPYDIVREAKNNLAIEYIKRKLLIGDKKDIRKFIGDNKALFLKTSITKNKYLLLSYLNPWLLNRFYKYKLVLEDFMIRRKYPFLSDLDRFGE